MRDDETKRQRGKEKEFVLKPRGVELQETCEAVNKSKQGVLVAMTIHVVLGVDS